MQPPAASNCLGPVDPGDNDPRGDGKPARRLALLGASVRAAAQSAQRAGFRVTGLDRFGDRDTLLACEHHVRLPDVDFPEILPLPAPRPVAAHAQALAGQIVQIARQMPVLPVGGLQGCPNLLRNVPLLAAWPGQQEAAANVRELPRLQAICKGSRFEVPPSYRRNDAKRTSFQRLATARWLDKSLESCGGLGTQWQRKAAAPGTDPCRSDHWVSSDHRVSSDHWVQQWVPGRLFGATLLSNGDDIRVLGICRSLFSRRGCFPFVYCGSLGPLSVAEPLIRDLETLAHRIVSNTGLRGLFTIDYLQEPSGRLWLLEINPRWSGSSELIEHDLRHRQGEISLIAWMLDALDGGPLRSTTTAGYRDSANRIPVYLKRIVFARRDHLFHEARIRSMLSEHESLHDLPASERWLRRGEPVCTLITRLSGQEKDPMRRHRVLVDQIAGNDRR